MDKDKNVISKCPSGNEPVESYNSSKSYSAKFKKSDCEKCPLRDQCPIKQQKEFNIVRVSEKRYNKDLQRAKMSLPEYIELTNQRAGVEGIPSVLRRRYRIDTMPVRGLLRSKLWVGFKIAAYNFKKLLAQLLKKGEVALANLFFTFLLNFSVTSTVE
ncbi:transposase [Clostridium thermarum]|uniref:transposase n=1 Tax=Clostridium thermarum TaxID=1716543 RepID=UPI0013D4856C|nr:transposase [Clostridium thermarum]